MISKNNNTCQQKTKTNSKKYFVYSIFLNKSAITKEEYENKIFDYLSSIKPAKRAMVEFLIKSTEATDYKEVFPSQTTIASKGGERRKEANQLTNDLDALGIIYKRQHYQNSCTYYLSSIFTDTKFRERLCGIFPILKKFSIYALFVTSGTPTMTFNLLNKQNNIQIQKFTAKEHGDQYNLAKTTRQIDNIIGLSSNVEDSYGENSLRQFNLQSNAALKIGEKHMETTLGKYLTPSIRIAAKFLNLNEFQQAKLVAFPDEIIGYSLNKYKTKKNISNPFGMIFMLCKDYCDAQGILPNWEMSKHLISEFKLKEHSTFVADNSIKGKNSQNTQRVKQYISLDECKKLVDEYHQICAKPTFEWHDLWGHVRPSYGQVKRYILNNCAPSEVELAIQYLLSSISTTTTLQPKIMDLLIQSHLAEKKHLSESKYDIAREVQSGTFTTLKINDIVSAINPSKDDSLFGIESESAHYGSIPYFADESEWEEV